MGRRATNLVVAVVAALTLADASVVCLALPAILVELDATVEEVAAVIGVYTLALAVALLPAAALRRALGSRWCGAVGCVVFAAASAACGLVDAIGPLLAARAVQAAGAALVLVAAFDLVDAAGRGARLWAVVAVFGTATGPALGGAVTQLFDWRAIFLVQAPIAALGALACALARRTASTRDAPAAPSTSGSLRARAAVALALASAALSAVLFLLVLLMVSGWSLEPLAAAAAVSILPVTAVLAGFIRGPDDVKAAAGCLLVGGGVLALAFLPDDGVGWTVAPQVLAGLGLGLSLPALGGGLLPERTPLQAARLLAVRHAGITVALALLAPVVSSQIDQAVEDTRLRGTALVLDAKLGPAEKIDVAQVLVADLDPEDPRDALVRAFDRSSAGLSDAGDRAVVAGLRERADDALVTAIDDAFAPAFLITGGLALLGGLLLVPRGRALAALVVAAAVPAGTALLAARAAPDPVVIADPCADRDLPSTGGLTGFVQDQALAALDRLACEHDSTREELVLALVDDTEARKYERKYDVSLKTERELLDTVLGVF